MSQIGRGQGAFSRDRQIEMPHQGQDRVVALATMDSATATVAALPAMGLYMVSPAASVSRIVAWLAFDLGKVGGAPNNGWLSEHQVRPRTNSE